MKNPFNKWAKWRPGKCIPVFFLSQFLGVQAQLISPAVSSLALGTIGTVRSEGGSSPGNPASLGAVKSLLFGAGHSCPFFIKEIGISSLECILPANPGSFQFRLSNYGITGYQNTSLALSYGMELSENLSAGIGFCYYNTIANREWNYLWNLGLDAGLTYRFSDKTSAGATISNPLTLGNSTDYGPLFPSSIRFGISQKIYDHTILYSEISQFSSGVLQVKLGLEYQIKSEIFLFSGYHSSPHSFSIGSAMHFGKVSMYTAVVCSLIPGISPSIQLTYTP